MADDEAKPNLGGRPTKLNPERAKKICDLIRTGNFFKVAAGANSINETTFHDWMRRGLKEVERLDENPEETVDSREKPYADFYLAVCEAEQEGEAALVLYWRQAATQDWHAARDLLARRHPERWADQTRYSLAVSGQVGVVGVPVPAEVSRQLLSTPEGRDAAARVIEILAQQPIALNPADMPGGDGDVPPSSVDDEEIIDGEIVDD